MWLALLAVAAAAAVYEYWLKPDALGPNAPALPPASGSKGLTPTPAAILADVPAARAWVHAIAATGFPIASAGDSLVNAILKIAQSLGEKAVPRAHYQLALYGRHTGTDWSSGLGAGWTNYPVEQVQSSGRYQPGGRP